MNGRIGNRETGRMGYALRKASEGVWLVRKETDRLKQRKEFVELYLKQRDEMTKLCELFGVSRKTGYKTWHGSEGGWEGLVERSHSAISFPGPAIQESTPEAWRRIAGGGASDATGSDSLQVAP
jgi:hypothetical protein